MEAELRFAFLGEVREVGAGRFEQRISADDVRLDEGRGAVDRAVDVAFRREVHDRIGLVLAEQRRHRFAVADVGLLESVARILCDRLQRLEVAGVGELVDVDDRMLGRSQGTPDDGRADEAGAAGH